MISEAIELTMIGILLDPDLNMITANLQSHVHSIGQNINYS